VISSEDQAVKYVHTRLLSTMTFIAKDVKIQVEFNPEHVFAYRLLGYENRDIPDDQFRDDALDAGEIGSGHTVTALYELVMVGRRVLPEELCRVRIRYKEVEANEQDPAFEVARGLRAGDVLSACSQGSADFQWAVAIAAFAEILKQSPYARPEALPAIAKIVSAAAGTDGDRLEFVELFKTAQTLLTQ
jgi:Ca-activated chloride channel family protein